MKKIGNLCEQNVMDDDHIHPWMKQFHPWMEMSSLDGNVIPGWKCHPWMSFIDGKTSSMDGSVIRECHPWLVKPHPWMISTDEDDR